MTPTKKNTARKGDHYQSFMVEMPNIFKVRSDKAVVFLPEDVGIGFSRNLSLEKGLNVRNLNFFLKGDFEFIRMPRKKGEEKTFQLYYFLDDTKFHFMLDADEEPLPPDSFSNILFLSNDIKIHGRFEKNDTVKMVVISFSLSWLHGQGFNTLENWKPFLTDTQERDHGILMMLSPDVADYKLAEAINSKHIPGSDFLFPIKANVLKLIERFYTALAEEKQPANSQRSDYFLQMIRVEKKVNEYLTSNLPLIKDLAREFNMSESNLKKHFRIVYKKNIYEYYLEKKMNLAKDMVLANGSQVSKIAYSLGYEKVASFSNAFKKAFGVLPSRLKPNTSPQI